MQCYTTQIWRINANGAIAPIVSERNRPNNKGITYKFGKKKGQLRKFKTLKEKHFKRISEENPLA